MKKNKNLPDSKKAKTGGGCDPVNKFKKDSTGIKYTDIIRIAVGNVKAKSGRGLANEGTNVEYNEGAGADYKEEAGFS